VQLPVEQGLGESLGAPLFYSYVLSRGNTFYEKMTQGNLGSVSSLGFDTMPEIKAIEICLKKYPNVSELSEALSRVVICADKMDGHPTGRLRVQLPRSTINVDLQTMRKESYNDCLTLEQEQLLAFAEQDKERTMDPYGLFRVLIAEKAYSYPFCRPPISCPIGVMQHFLRTVIEEAEYEAKEIKIVESKGEHNVDQENNSEMIETPLSCAINAGRQGVRAFLTSLDDKLFKQVDETLGRSIFTWEASVSLFCEGGHRASADILRFTLDENNRGNERTRTDLAVTVWNLFGARNGPIGERSTRETETSGSRVFDSILNGHEIISGTKGSRKVIAKGKNSTDISEKSVTKILENLAKDAEKGDSDSQIYMTSIFLGNCSDEMWGRSTEFLFGIGQRVWSDELQERERKVGKGEEQLNGNEDKTDSDATKKLKTESESSTGKRPNMSESTVASKKPKPSSTMASSSIPAAWNGRERKSGSWSLSEEEKYKEAKKIYPTGSLKDISAHMGGQRDVKQIENHNRPKAKSGKTVGSTASKEVSSFLESSLASLRHVASPSALDHVDNELAMRQQAAPIIPLQLNIDPEDAAIIAVLDHVDNELAMRQQAAPIIPLQLNIDPEDAAIIAVLDRVDNELAMRQQAAPNETK
jgi:hypothetical protein